MDSDSQQLIDSGFGSQYGSASYARTLNQRRFYRDVLGLSELKAGDDWVWFDFEGKLLELLAKSPLPQYDRRRVSFAFDVDDIQSARSILIERGVEPVTEIEGGPESLQYWAYFRDAEGNLFELVQRLR